MDRRTVLALLAGTGVGGYGLTTDRPIAKARNTAGSALDSTGSALDSATAGRDRSTETIVKTVDREPTRFQTFLIQKVVLYESGMAEIYFAEDHGCFERVAFVHEDLNVQYNDLSEAAAVWQAPKFEGPITVDLAGAIDPNTDYPSRRFRLKMFAKQGNVCIASQDSPEFTVPSSYME